MCRRPSQQAFYAGLEKPQEVGHDAAIYRMYQADATQIAEQNGVIRRVLLDYPLKKKICSPLARARTLPSAQVRKMPGRSRASNGPKVIRGKIPLPDLRIDYETAEGDLAKVDLELATEHFTVRRPPQKARPGSDIMPIASLHPG